MTETLAKTHDFEVRLHRGAEHRTSIVTAGAVLELPGTVFDPVSARLHAVDEATGRWIVSIETARLRPIASPATAGVVNPSQREEGFRREVSFAIRITGRVPELVCQWPGNYTHVSQYAGSHSRTVHVHPLDDAAGVVVDTTEYHREYEGQQERTLERIELPETGPCKRSLLDPDA